MFAICLHKRWKTSLPLPPSRQGSWGASKSELCNFENKRAQKHSANKSRHSSVQILATLFCNVLHKLIPPASPQEHGGKQCRVSFIGWRPSSPNQNPSRGIFFIAECSGFDIKVFVLVVQILESSPDDCQRRIFCSRLAAPRCRCCFASRQLFERTLVPTIPLFFPSFYVQVVGLFGILNFPGNFFGGKQNHSLPPSPPSSYANPLSPTLNLLPLSPPLWVSEWVSEWLLVDFLQTNRYPIENTFLPF